MNNDPIDRVDKLLATRSQRELALLVVETEKRIATYALCMNTGGVDELSNRLVEAEKGRDAAVEMRDAATFIASKIKRMAEEQHARAEAAEQQSAQLRSALAELVRLKDMKESFSLLNHDQEWQQRGEYDRCKPLAWAAAHKALEP